jgi:uncharacterized protein (DUF1778 family)
MNDKEPMGFRVDADLKRLLKRAADADKRSMSSLITKILSDWTAQWVENQKKKGTQA